MKKRIRKKLAKRAAEGGEVQRPMEALHDAVEELKDSALHLLETARSELQQGAALWVDGMLAKAQSLLSQFKLGTAGGPRRVARVETSSSAVS